MVADDLMELLLRFGWKAALAIQACVAALFLWVFVLQMRRRRLAKRRTELIEVWQPVLAESLIEIPAALPRLTSRDHISFLFLWNYLQESVKGEATEQLNRLARMLGLDEAARRLLRKTNMKHKLLAVATLGRLKDAAVWCELTTMANGDAPALSLEALRAMVRIDAEAAIPVLASLIGTRRDWSPLKIMAILDEAGPERAAKAMTLITASAQPMMMARLIRYLAAAHCRQALPTVRGLLQRSDQPDDLTAACLSFMGESGDPEDLPLVRRHLRHPVWYVRLQAAAALGKMGGEQDEPRLVHLLEDEHWWVRYRAAEALSNLPSMSEEKLAALQLNMPSVEAQEIIIPFIAQLRLKRLSLPAA